MRVLITRPAHLATTLSYRLKDAGFIPNLFPTLEFAPTPHQADLLNGLRHLDHHHILIFASRAAVHFGMTAIQNYWSAPLPCRFAAIGPGTASELQRFDIKNILIPKPPYESESLLALPEFQQIKDLKIAIFRGNGGRALLPETLSTRGAIVQMIECYQRRLPTVDIVEILNSWQTNPIDAIITTSQETLNNLIFLVGDRGFRMIRDIPIVIVGSRMLELANRLKIRHPVIADGAEDDALLQAMTKVREIWK